MTERRKAKPYQPRWWALIVIRGYQKVLSPFFGQSCRFQPTCSRYGYRAIDEYGLVRGGDLIDEKLLVGGLDFRPFETEFFPNLLPESGGAAPYEFNPANGLLSYLIG